MSAGTLPVVANSFTSAPFVALITYTRLPRRA
jgi:hypothetical protein